MVPLQQQQRDPLLLQARRLHHLRSQVSLPVFQVLHDSSSSPYCSHLAVNIFSSDGSFLERFKKQAEESTKEKKQQEESLAR